MFFLSEFEKVKNSEYVASSELAVKILFPSIVVIALLQSIHFVHCQLTMKMSVMEKKMKEKPTENSILLLTMRYVKK